MWYIVFLFIIGLNVLFNYYLNKTTGYPPFLFSLVWFIIVFFHFLCYTFDLVIIFGLSFKALAIYTLGVVMFTLGGLAIKLKVNFEYSDPEENHFFEIRKNFDTVLILITLIFLPFFLISSYRLAIEYMIFDSLFAGLRNSTIQEQDIGFSKYGTNFAYISFFLQFYIYSIKKNNSTKLFISALILLIFCAFSTGRTFFIVYLSLIFGILIVFQKLKKKHLFYAFSGFLILFSTVGILLNNGGSTENNLEENISGLAGNFMIYLLGSLSAFDAFIHSNYIITYGENSFRFIYSVLYKIGSLESKPSELVDQYVSIPFDTNVYTLYKIYFQDFGILFMMLVVFCMSLLHTYYYLKAINGRQFMPTFIYSVMLYPLFMSFFQEQYLSLMPTWIFFIFIALVVKLFLVEKGALIE
jgi:oligosaccharide repeat unit polymerase